MLLKTLVKISAVNNLSDARYCAGMGVAMMGFPLDSNHAHYVNPEQFKAITQWIKGVALIGELNSTNPVITHHTLEQYALDYLQLIYPVKLQDIIGVRVPILLKIGLQGDETIASLQALMNAYAPYIKYFLLEAISGHEATSAALQPTIDCLARSFSILQGCQVSVTTLPHLLSTKLQGIALQSGMETKPGYKDFEQLAEVLALLSVEQP
jgi:phosphoribosylanthranilate isomerase